MTETKLIKMNLNSLIISSELSSRELHLQFIELSEENPLFMGPICS